MKFKNHARATARNAAVDVAAKITAVRPNAQRHLQRPRVHFLFFHALAPEDRARFDSLLSRLAADHTFLPYSQAVRKLTEGPIDRPYVSFSFDDGLKSNLHVAEALERHGTTGMFFVPPTIVGCNDIDKVRAFYRFAPEVKETTMSWDDLARLKDRGHEVGNHTLNHLSLNEISLAQATDEIHSGAEAIRLKLGECEHFAWPRGAFTYFPGALRPVVYDSGHKSCASGVRGAHVAVAGSPSQLCIRRDLVASYWPEHHNLYFITKSARKASALDNEWPKPNN